MPPQLVLDHAADGISVPKTCRVLGLTERAFSTCSANPVTDRDRSDAHLIDAAIGIQRDDPESGYRPIADELTDRGVVASRNRVQRLCS